MEKVLRKEQAGSRQGRSTTEQVIILRNILEQSCEWRTPLNAYFVDFEKAFDSVHRSSLWIIMRAFQKRSPTKAMYESFKCAVIDEGQPIEAGLEYDLV